MKMVRVEMVVYYEAQDATSVEEAKDVVVDLAKMNGLSIQYSKAELIWDKPDEEIEEELANDMRDYCERYEPTYNPEDGSM